MSRLEADILDLRARLILRENRFASDVRREAERAVPLWRASLTDLLAASALTGTQISELRRVSEVLRALRRITAAELFRVRSMIEGVASEVYVSEAYRLAGLLEPVGVNVSASLYGVNTRAMAVARSGPLPGLSYEVALGRISRRVEAAMRRQLSDAIRDGYTLDRLVRQWSRPGGPGRYLAHEAENLARTGLMTASSAAARSVYDEAPDLEVVGWNATFDRRTCPRCGNLHGRRFPKAEAPPQPAHYRCRCTYIPEVRGRANSRATPGDARVRGRSDGEFERWLRSRPVDLQRGFFPSRLKYSVWKSKTLTMGDLVSKDGSIRTDPEVRALLRRRGLPVPGAR